MVDEARITTLLNELNQALGSATPYKLAFVDPSTLCPAPRNAHYMPKAVFDRMTANIAEDGNLASLPLCWQQPDNIFMIISGHHRVQAAVVAGIAHILILYTNRQLHEGERIAQQLAHNALVGLDNSAILQELWQTIETVHLKEVTGLDEKALERLGKIDLRGIHAAKVPFEELRLLFVSSELDHVDTTMKRIGKATRVRYAARVEEFERFFQTLLRFKQAKDIQNTSTAFLAMIDIVTAWLDQHEQDTSKVDTHGPQ